MAIAGLPASISHICINAVKALDIYKEGGGSIVYSAFKADLYTELSV